MWNKQPLATGLFETRTCVVAVMLPPVRRAQVEHSKQGEARGPAPWTPAEGLRPSDSPVFHAVCKATRTWSRGPRFLAAADVGAGQRS
jgi:hypothetical protein